MAKALKIPKLCLHKASGRAYAKRNGKRVYFGKYGTDEAVEAYNRFVADIVRGDEQPIEEILDRSELSVAELAAAYLQWSEGYYVKNGKPTSQQGIVRMVIRSLLACHRTTDVKDFTPLVLRSIQTRLVNEGGTRVNINLVIAGIVKIFKWGVARELVDVRIHQALKTVESLKKGRTKAPETPPVKPVLDKVVDASLPHMNPVVADMVRLQRLTGMRPGEVCKLRPCDVDRSGEVWEYRPASHKTEHHDQQRVVYFGPKAQAILAPYLLRAADTPCFPSQRSPSYSYSGYFQAIKDACIQAGVEHWSPNQLRHTAGTEVRKLFGVESAQVTLGHTKADTTQIYAEKNAELAREVARRIG